MTTLAEERPYAAAVANERLADTCSGCFSKSGDPLQRCTGCRALHYCNRACQRADWIDHKLECGYLKNVTPRVPPPTARLMMRIHEKWKVRGELGKAFNGRTIEGLVDHLDDIRASADRISFFVSLCHVLHDCLGERCPKPDVLLTIFGKVMVNVFRITEHVDYDVLGDALYVGLSGQDHACAPDAFVVFRGATAILRTPKAGMTYDLKITIGYAPPLLREKRRAWLKEQFYFDCDCSKCQDPDADAIAQAGRCTATKDCPGVCQLQEPLVCTTCGKPPSYSTSELQQSNSQLAEFLDKVHSEKEGDEEFVARALERDLEQWEMHAKILADSNLHLAQLANDLHMLLSTRPNHGFDEMWRYSKTLADGYRRNIPLGHPSLAHALHRAAWATANRLGGNLRETGELWKEAHTAAFAAYGPGHPFFEDLDRQVKTFPAAALRT